MLAVLTFIGATVNLAKELSKANQPPPVDDDYADVNEGNPIPIFELVQAHITGVTIALYIVLALCILSVITSSMLIHGVKHNRRGLLTPFLIQEIVNVIVLAALIIWSLVIFEGHETVVYSALGTTAFLGLHVYFALVIFSQYQALGLIRMHEEISMK